MRFHTARPEAHPHPFTVDTPATYMTPFTRSRCIRSLEEMLNRRELPQAAVNSCKARLAQLKREAASPAAIVAQPRKAAAPAVDRFAVMQTWMELCKKRSAMLHRWGRLSREDHSKLLSLVALLPDTAPSSDCPKAWQNFAARVAAAKTETI